MDSFLSAPLPGYYRHRRKPLPKECFRCSLLLGLLVLTLTSITFVSFSHARSTVMSYSWSRGSTSINGETVKMFIGGSCMVFEVDNGTYSLIETECYASANCTEKYCVTCRTAMVSVLAFLVVFWVCNVVSIVGFYYRVQRANTRVNKFGSFLVGLVSIAFGLAAFLQSQTCADEVHKVISLVYFDGTVSFFLTIAAFVSLTLATLISLSILSEDEKNLNTCTFASSCYKKSHHPHGTCVYPMPPEPRWEQPRVEPTKKIDKEGMQTGVVYSFQPAVAAQQTQVAAHQIHRESLEMVTNKGPSEGAYLL